MNSEIERSKIFEDAMVKYEMAKRDYPYVDHGPEPDHKNYGIGEWLAGQIAARVRREIGRKS